MKKRLCRKNRGDIERNAWMTEEKKEYTVFKCLINVCPEFNTLSPEAVEILKKVTGNKTHE